MKKGKGSFSSEDNVSEVSKWLGDLRTGLFIPEVKINQQKEILYHWDAKQCGIWDQQLSVSTQVQLPACHKSQCLAIVTRGVILQVKEHWNGLIGQVRQ